MGILTLLMPLRIYLEPMMPLMVGLMAHGMLGRRAVLTVFALRILRTIVMSKALNRACNAAVKALAEICINAY